MDKPETIAKNFTSKEHFVDPKKWLAQALEHSNLSAQVAELNDQSFYFIVQEIGLEDAHALLKYATVSQLQTCFDLVGWHKDRLTPTKILPWLSALLDSDPAHAAQVMIALDHEWIVSFLRPLVLVYQREADQDLPEAQGQYYLTPDQFYAVDVIQAPEVVIPLLDNLYQYDLTQARRIVMGVLWDVGAETEELAYQFRKGRLEDLGYTDYYEALAVYTQISPTQVLNQYKTAIAESDIEISPTPVSIDKDQEIYLLPSILIDFLRTSPLFVILKDLNWSQGQRWIQQVLHLTNQVLVAEGISSGEEDPGPLLQRVVAYLGLGIDFLLQKNQGAALTVSLSENDKQTVVSIMKNVPPKTLFRLAHSLITPLVQLARLLRQKSLFSLDSRTLLIPSPWRQTIKLLLKSHAEFNNSLYQDEIAAKATLSDSMLNSVSTQINRRDFVSTHKVTEEPSGAKPFGLLSEIALTTRVLEKIGLLSQFLTQGLGIRIEGLRERLTQLCTNDLFLVTWDHLVGSILIQAALGRPLVLWPIDLAHWQILQPRLTPAMFQQVWPLVLDKLRERGIDNNLEDYQRYAFYVWVELCQDEPKLLWGNADNEALDKKKPN